MRNIQAFLAATPLFLACASVPERKPAVAQNVDTSICAKLAIGEAVDSRTWPEALGGTVDEVRDACAAAMNDPEFCPNATSVGLSRTFSFQPSLLPRNLALEARERCLKLLEPRGKGAKCTPSGGFGMRTTL